MSPIYIQLIHRYVKCILFTERIDTIDGLQHLDESNNIIVQPNSSCSSLNINPLISNENKLGAVMNNESHKGNLF